MARPSRAPHLAALGLLALAAGCAEPGPYPSLAPRPIEAELAALDEAPPPPPLPDNPDITARAAEIAAQARGGSPAFEAALAAAERAVRAAGAPGSDSWVAAQQAVSRVEASRAATTRALGELDAYSVSSATTRPLSPTDLERLAAIVGEVQAIADRQSEALSRLQRALRPL
ncbi:MAG TPA: hypothetical protein VGB62_07530 [Allosphingosinicella sp.]|jgi:hypothetical protein